MLSLMHKTTGKNFTQLWRFDVNYGTVICGSIQINQRRILFEKPTWCQKDYQNFAGNSKFDLQKQESKLIKLIKIYAKRKTLLLFHRDILKWKLTSIMSFCGTRYFCVIANIVSSPALKVSKFLCVEGPEKWGWPG